MDNNNQILQNEAIGPQAVPQQQNGQVPTVQAEARTNANEEHEEERPGALCYKVNFLSFIYIFKTKHESMRWSLFAYILNKS